MPGKTSLIRVLFGRTPKVILGGVLFAFLALTFLPLLNHSTPKATAAVPSTLNFQARLLSSNGSIVPDGYYNVEFKLYDAQSGGTNVWTETWYDSNGVTAGNDNRIQVKNGYLSVYLGDINTNLATLDWTQQHWLTMNVGGTTQTATPTYDGEMSPRLRLTSVPYAQAAADSDKLDGIDSTGFAQLAPGSVQGASSANSLLRLNQTGAGGLLQLQSGGTDMLTLSNGGNLAITGDITVSGGDVTAAASLTVSATGAGNDLILSAADQIQLSGFNCTTFVNGGNLTTDSSGNIVCADDDGGGGGGGGAPTTASYLTLGLDGTLTAERVLTAGTNISITDGGANSTLTVDVISNPTFSGLITANNGLTVATGSTLTNASSTLLSALSVSDVSGGGNIGTAAATVDVSTTFNVNQTTSGQTLTLPTPSTTTAGRIVYINNTGSATFTMYGVSVAAGATQSYIWNGTVWVKTSVDGSGGGATSVVNDTNVTGTISSNVLTLGWTGTLSIARGGTGAGTLTTNGILYGNGTSAIQATSAAANSILATNGSNIPSLTQTLPTAVQGNITSLGTITSGVWNGTALTDTYVSDTLTIGSASSVDWTALNNYPAACSAGEAITALGDTVTCTAFAAGSGSGSYIQNGTAAQNSANMNIQSVGTTNVTVKLRANTSQTADIIQVRDSTDTSTVFSVSPAGAVVGASFSGDGSALTALNATQLTSGTVPSARISGSYTGITGLGTITVGTWNGTALTDAYVSDTLTASNLVGSGSTTNAVDLPTAEVNGILGATNGGTGNGFTAFTGPATATKTFTLPNASATILTTNAAVTVGQGGTGATTLTLNGILYGNGTSAIQATSAAANSILATNGSNIPSLTQTLPTAVQGNITSLGTITSGVWNGTALTDTYVSDTLTIGSASSVDWTALNNYPAACSAGEAITALGDTVTCTAFAAGSGSGSYIQNGTAAQNSANMNIQSVGTTNVTVKLRANTSQTADIIQVRDSTDTSTVFSVSPAGAVVGASFSGDGSALTALNATQLTSGTVPSARISGSYTGITGLGTITVGTWNGTALTDAYVSDTLTASNLVGSGSTTNAVDLPTAEVNGILGATNGGTGNGFTAFTGPATATKTFTLPNASATILTTNAAVTVGQGGTGATTLTLNGILYGNGTSAIQATSAAANSILATNGSNIPSLTQTLPTAVQGNITSLGTITSGVWNGTALTDTYVSDTLTIGSASSVDWTALNNYPAACSAGEAITALGDTVTCTAFAAGSGSGSYIQNGTAAQNSANMNIQSVGTTNVTVKLRANTSQTADIIQVRDSTDTSTVFSVSPAGAVVGASFSGDGSALTALNATQLTSGTVPSARISGSYTGITGLGTITVGTWNGTALTDAYVSDTLTASNLVGSGSTTNAVDLPTAEVNGILGATNGGTGNGFTAFTGPATATKTFTLPNASATILTTNAAVTVGQGGTGATTLTLNGILYGNGTSAIQATSAAANSILATNGSNIPSLTQTLPTAVQGNITSLGTITSGVWNGTALTDTYVSDTLTIGSASSVDWTALNNYPAACSAGEAITALGDTVTCTAFAAGSGSGSYIQNGTAAQNSANMNIQSVGTTNVTVKLRANTSQTADIIQVRDSTDTSTVFSVSPAGAVVGASFSGDGSALTALNATQLTSGTVPSARISGSYTGITGLGTITVGTWNGTALTDAYVSDTLTASNLVGSGSTTNAVDLPTAEVNGILGATNGGTGNGFTAFTGPATATKTFTLPNASATILTTNAAVTVGQGGTGATTLTLNGILYGNGTSAIQATSAAANSILATNGSNIPSLTQTLPTAVQGNITSLGTITSGVWNGTAIGAAYGGTGQTSYTIGDLLYASGTTTLGKLAAVSAGQCLLSSGVGAAPVWGSCSGGSGAFVQGGNSFTAVGVLGTNDNYDLQLEANGTTMLTLEAGGDIIATADIVATGGSWLVSEGGGLWIDNSSNPGAYTEIGSDYITMSSYNGAQKSTLHQTGNEALSLTSASPTDNFHGLFIQSNQNASAYATLEARSSSGQTADVFVASNSSGTKYLSVSSSGNTALIGNLSVTGTSSTFSNGAGTDDNIAIVPAALGSGTTFTGTITNANLTAARTYTLPNLSGTLAVTNANQTISNTQTFSGTLSVTGTTTIGDAVTDNLTITSAIIGANAFVLDGATNDTNEITIAVTDPGADYTLTIPAATGTFITTGNLTDITTTGTITAGTWNGTAITDAYINDAITISSSGSVDWTALNNYPAACSAGEAITALGDTVTCSPFSTSGGANQALSNLSGVAINTSLLPGTDDSIDLGDNTHRWRDLYLGGDTLHIGASLTDEGVISYNSASNVLTINTDTTSNGNIELAGGSGSTGCTITSTTGALACSSTINGASVSSSAVNGLTFSGTAITASGALNINASGANAIAIGGTSTGDITLGGGSGSTGCTVTNATGVLACSSNINSVGGAFQLNGTDINTAGTLTNVAYENQANTFTLGNTFSATSDAIVLSGAPSASATASALRLGAAIAGGSANGTYIGGNPAAFTGDFINLQVGGAVRLRVTNAGATTVGNTLTVTTGGASITGNSSVTGTLGVSSTLTASNGLTVTTGAVNITGTSGALALSGLGASSINTGANALTVTSSNFNTTATGINSTAIGATTASTGAFTTLGATGTSTLVAINASGAYTQSGAGANTFTGATSITGGATIRGVTVNTATATDDQILMSVTAGGAARFNGTITNADLTAARTWTLPNETGTICTTGSVCSGYQASGSYANTALSNLSGVAINTSLLPATDDSIDLGDNTHRWRDLYLGGDTLHIGTSTTDEGVISYNTTTNVLSINTDTTTNGNIDLAGGSGSTGCSVTSSTGALACSSTVNGATLSGGSLSGTAVNGLSVSGGTVSVGTWQGTAVGATYGGTGQTSYAVGDLLYANTTTTLGKLAAVAAGQCLVSNGVGAAPTWGSCSVNGWSDGGTLVSLLTSTDNVTIGSASALGKLAVDGDTDEIQLLVQGNATQTTNLVVFENSAGTDVLTVTNAGAVTGGTYNGLTVSGTAITGSGALAINASGTNTIDIGATSTGNINLGGGSGSTGCTVTNSTGAFACTSTINSLTLSGTAITAAGALNVGAGGANNLTLSTNATTRWTVTSAGILQSNGAQTIQTSSGNLTINAAGASVLALQTNGSTRLSVSSTGIATFTGPVATSFTPASWTQTLIVDNAATSTSNIIEVRVAGTRRGSLRVNSSGGTNLNGSGTGAVNLAFDEGTGGVTFGNGAQGIVASVNSSGNFSAGTYNSQTISSSANFTGTVEIFNGLKVTQMSSPAFNGQGAYIGWNASGGAGETDFVNHQGLGGGGFNFYTTATNGSLGSLLMDIRTNYTRFPCATPTWGYAFGYAQCSDVAEAYKLVGDAERGDVLVMSSSHPGSVEKSTGEAQQQLIGVYSTSPGLLVGSGNSIYVAGVDGAIAPGDVPVALTGRVPVNIGSDSDPIQVGDYLTSSSIPGKAKKATSPGTALGKAMTAWSPGDSVNQVMMYASLGYSDPANTLAQIVSGELSMDNLNVSGTAHIANLTVTGSVSVGGNLAVTGDTTVANLYVGGKLVSRGAKPTTAVGAALLPANNATAAVTVSGNDTAGTVTIDTKEAVNGQNQPIPFTTGSVAEVTFSSPYGVQPRVMVTATDENSAVVPVFVENTPTGFKIKFAAAPDANKVYTFNYFTIGAEEVANN